MRMMSAPPASPADSVSQRHLVRLLAAGAENGAPQRQDAGNVLLMEDARMILDQAAKALFDADHFNVEIAHGRLGHAANGRVEPGTIAPAGQNPNASRLGCGHDFLSIASRFSQRETQT